MLAAQQTSQGANSQPKRNQNYIDSLCPQVTIETSSKRPRSIVQPGKLLARVRLGAACIPASRGTTSVGFVLPPVKLKDSETQGSQTELHNCENADGKCRSPRNSCRQHNLTSVFSDMDVLYVQSASLCICIPHGNRDHNDQTNK